MKAELDLKRFTVNENGPALHFIAATSQRVEKAINLINALSQPPTSHQNVFKMFQKT